VLDVELRTNLNPYPLSAFCILFDQALAEDELRMAAFLGFQEPSFFHHLLFYLVLTEMESRMILLLRYLSLSCPLLYCFLAEVEFSALVF
jgi:hypothetical protein